jgi:hypothetical protein
MAEESGRMLLLVAGGILIAVGLLGILAFWRHESELNARRKTLRIREKELIRHSPAPAPLPGESSAPDAVVLGASAEHMAEQAEVDDGMV